VSGNKRTLRREVNWQKSVEMAFKDAPPSRIEHLVGQTYHNSQCSQGDLRPAIYEIRNREVKKYEEHSKPR
jgi:hypothetical protein